MSSDFPVLEREAGKWYFAEPVDSSDPKLALFKWYGPYRSKDVAEERREAIRAFTDYQPGCHHDHNRTYAGAVR